MFRALLVAVVTASLGIAHAEPVQRAEIYEFGIYSSSPAAEVGLSRQGVPQTIVDSIDLIDATQTIIARIGVEFGFRFRLIGTSRGRTVPITYVMKYPPPGILAPKKSIPFVEDVYTWPGFLDGRNFRTFRFESRSDLVPGIWTIEVWVGGKKLSEQKFNVILPPIA